MDYSKIVCQHFPEGAQETHASRRQSWHRFKQGIFQMQPICIIMALTNSVTSQSLNWKDISWPIKWLSTSRSLCSREQVPLSHMGYIYFPSHSSCFNHTSNISWRAQNVKLVGLKCSFVSQIPVMYLGLSYSQILNLGRLHMINSCPIIYLCNNPKHTISANNTSRHIKWMQLQEI
jgi:hypothetical protein